MQLTGDTLQTVIELANGDPYKRWSLQTVILINADPYNRWSLQTVILIIGDPYIVNLETRSTFENFSKLPKKTELSNPTLSKLVDDFYESIKTKENYINHYDSIRKETLAQDGINWGRIVTFVSFTKILLDKSIQDGRLDIAK